MTSKQRVRIDKAGRRSRERVKLSDEAKPRARKAGRAHANFGKARLRYTRQEVAHKLGVSISTVMRRERDGKVKPIRDVAGGHVYWSHADLMRLAGQT